MRGVTALELAVPSGGWRQDVPPHKLPPDALLDGLNIYCGEDGLMTSRRGYDALAQQLPFTERVMKGISWSGDGGQQLVVSGLTRWAALVGGVFVDITDVPQSGDAATPVRFAQFGVVHDKPGVVNGTTTVYGVNGAIHDPMRYWSVDDVTYHTMTDTARNDFQFAANDIAVVADRLVAINTNEGGVFYPRRVRWSSVLDGQSWPALAFSDRLGDAGNLIAIQVTSRTSAVLYCESGAWLMTAVGGDDANAFVFSRIFGVDVGPYSPDSIVNKGGVHYFLATDNRVHACDGSNADIISTPIDAGLQQRLAVGAGALGLGAAQKPVGVYDLQRRRMIWFVAFKGESDNFHAIALNLFTKHWEVPWELNDAITAAFPVIEMFGPTWDNPGIDPATGQPWTWDSAPWPSWNDIPENEAPAMYIGTATGALMRFGNAGTDNGTPIAYRAVWGLVWPQDMTRRQQVNTAEVLLQPISPEPMTMRIRGFKTPFDPAPTTILSQPVQQDDPDQWTVRLAPLVAQAAFRNANYLEASVSGQTTQGAPSFAGETLFTFVIDRPDLEAGVTANV